VGQDPSSEADKQSNPQPGVRPSWYTTTGLLVDCCNATVPIETLVLAQDAAFEIAHEE